MTFGDEYIDNIKKIWKYTALPSHKEISEKGLYDTFCTQYAKARLLSAKNNDFVKSEIMPLLDQEKELTDEEMEKLEGMARKLVNLQDKELIDRMLCLKIHEKLWCEAARHENRRDMLRQAAEIVQLLYHVCTVLGRTGFEKAVEMRRMYSAKALDYIAEAKKWLPLDMFRQLTEDERSYVLSANRIEFLFYRDDTVESVHKQIELAKNVLELSDNEEYRQLFPEINKKKDSMAALYYLTVCGEYMSVGLKYDTEDIKTVRDACIKQIDFIKNGGQSFTNLSEAYRMFNYVCYVSGEMSSEEYLQRLWADYNVRNEYLYDNDGIDQNLFRASKLIEVLNENLDKNPKYPEKLGELYTNIAKYIMRMPRNSCEELILNYAISTLSNFVEVPGVVSFANISNLLMSYASPSTYVHSQMVGSIAQTIGSYLIDNNPAVFVGVDGCEDIQQVRLKKQRLLNRLYMCGVFHDIGKLPYLDVIGVTYRSFFAQEYDMIKLHSGIGYSLLEKYDSTRCYANIAFGHHRWYDGKGGYPEEFDRSKVPDIILADIIELSDCMDAATDTIFRSYNKGITLGMFVEETRRAGGTRYNPDVIKAILDEEVQTELGLILSEGREECYLCTYKLYGLAEADEDDSYKAETGLKEAKQDTKQEKIQTNDRQVQLENGSLSEEQINKQFNDLFDRLEKVDYENFPPLCEEIRVAVLTNILNDRVRHEYIDRFHGLMEIKNYQLGKAAVQAMIFWREHVSDSEKALEANELGLRYVRKYQGYKSTKVYMSLINNAVLGNIRTKQYIRAYEYAKEGIKALREDINSPLFYYSILGNCVIMLEALGLYGKASRIIDECLKGKDLLPRSSIIALEFRKAEIYMDEGNYDVAQRLYMDMLKKVKTGEFIEPGYLYARLVVLSYRRKNGVALNYWHGELLRSTSSQPNDFVSEDVMYYAGALYYAWIGQYKEAEKYFDLLTGQIGNSSLDQHGILRDALEFFESCGNIIKANELYRRLDDLNRNAMSLLDDMTDMDGVLDLINPYSNK